MGSDPDAAAKAGAQRRKSFPSMLQSRSIKAMLASTRLDIVTADCHAAADLPRELQMPVVCKIFVGGGFDDKVTHIVENYHARYAEANPDYQCHYFPWKNEGGIARTINALAADAHITLVGHSYGADAAFSVVAASARALNSLISIDPVGHFRPAWASIRGKCRIWLNVRAEPSGSKRTFDDSIAWIGGKYPRPPAPGEAGAPNYSIIANATHGAFSTMMAASGGGMSGRVLLGGRSVG